MKPILPTNTVDKPAELALRMESGVVFLIVQNALNKHNEPVALLKFTSEKIESCICAKECIEESGVDTTFSEWDELGGVKIS